MKTDNACRTIKDSQKRWACFDAGGPSRRSPTIADPVFRTFAANLRRLFLTRDWSPYAVYQRGRKIALPWSSQSAALRVPPLSQALMS
jgi:hypothetical protein